MIIGRQFDRAKVSASADRSLYDYLNDGRSTVLTERANGLNVTANGLILTVATGEAIIEGALIQVKEPIDISVPPNYQGYLVIMIDLSQLNSATGTPGNGDYAFTNNQLSILLVDTIVTQDLNNNGLLYTFKLGDVNSNTATITFTKNEYAYGATEWIEYVPELNNLFDYYTVNEYIYYSKKGNQVTLTGVLSTSASTANSLVGANSLVAFSLPEEIRPKTRRVWSSQPATSDFSYMLYLNLDGTVNIGRFAGYASSDNVWIPFYITYLI